jgi:serine/threonine protein kinase
MPRRQAIDVDVEHWTRFRALLDELLDADVPQRVARLSEVRVTDPALADAVAALLDRQSAVDAEAFLEGSAFPVATQLAGRKLGHYTLERPIGHGGMGAVWLARRSDGRFEGTVAVKFLNLALLAGAGAERFEREGRLLARLEHPNIARLLDAGVDADQPYLILEYVDGDVIDRWCDAHQLGLIDRIRLFLDVLAAVGHAHSHLVLHRDLKPANILVTPAGAVKLLDFGIAKLLDGPDEAPRRELTEVSGPAFTPAYAAPEQVQAGGVSMATDVYALGVLLCELLTGTHPTSAFARTPVDRLRALIDV